MSRPSVLTLLVLAIGAGAIGTAFAAMTRARARRDKAKPAAARNVSPGPRLRPVTATPRRPAPDPGSFRIAEVKPGRSIALRAKPGGGVVARASAVTEFGSRARLSVAEARGGWLGVTSTLLPNGKVAWVRDSNALEMHHTAMSIRVDLSKRRLELRDGARLVRRFGVAIGRPGSPTPTGRFAVTDKLSGSRYGAYYGCCILALSGHQPHPPPGWQGGDRLAIHGTDSPGTIGTSASAGCLRAADADLQVLMRRVPLGTPVFIRG